MHSTAYHVQPQITHDMCCALTLTHVLWKKLKLPELKRANSSKRPASEANVGDIVDALQARYINSQSIVLC